MYFDIEKYENPMRRYGCGHIEGGRMDPKVYPRGLAEVEVLRDIGDRESGKQKVCDIGDFETPKPNFSLFLS